MRTLLRSLVLAALILCLSPSPGAAQTVQEVHLEPPQKPTEAPTIPLTPLEAISLPNYPERPVFGPLSYCADLEQESLPERGSERVKTISAQVYVDIRCRLRDDPVLSRYVNQEGKIEDEFLMALLISGEFGTSINRYDPFYLESLEAISFEYHNPRYRYSCKGECETIKDQLTWIVDTDSFRYTGPEKLFLAALNNLAQEDSSAKVAIDGYIHGMADSVVWGNYTKDSPMARYVENGGCAEWMKKCASPFTALELRYRAVVFSSTNNLSCRAMDPSCVGW